MCRSLPPLLRKLLQDRVLQVVLHGLNMYMSMKCMFVQDPMLHKARISTIHLLSVSGLVLFHFAQSVHE